MPDRPAPSRRPPNRLARALLLLLAPAAVAAGPVAAPAQPVSIERHVGPVPPATAEEAAGGAAVDWAAVSESGYIRAPRGSAAWLRITLRNPGDTPVTGALTDTEYHTDRLELFVRAPDGTLRREVTGETVPAAEKPSVGRAAGFPLTLPAHTEHTAYLRATDATGVDFRLRWWPDARDWRTAEFRDALAEGAYFGVAGLLFLYGAVWWLRLRRHDIAWYLGYLLGVAGFMAVARGFPAQLGATLGSPGTETLLAVTLAGAAICAGRFASAYLEFPDRLPRFTRARRAAEWALLTAGIAGGVAPWFGSLAGLALTAVLTTAYHAALLLAARQVRRTGLARAGWFLLSFGVLFLTSLPLTAAWLASAPAHAWFRVALAGSAFELLLLSFVIAQRFEEEQAAKLTAQSLALAEADHRRALQEAYADELEHEVRERTRELAAANADQDRLITVLGHDLRAPLTGITQTAGALAAGGTPEKLTRFAADTAVTGRAALLLIEDLGVWGRLRAGRPPVPADCPVEAVITPVSGLYARLAADTGRLLELGPCAGLRVRADLVIAQTLLRNLVDNALKHARSRVRVSVEETPAGIRFRVEDDGPGLPAGTADALRDDRPPAGDPAATGLGLPLCRELGARSGTQLDASRSDTLGGARLTFTLPKA